MGVPRIPDKQTLSATDMNPKTGERNSKRTGFSILEGFKKQLRILDEQNAVNRYTWYNLPDDLDGQFIERILYYRGQGTFFYIKEEDKFYFLPYNLNTKDKIGIDVYGRYTGIKPFPFTGKAETSDKDVYIPGLVLDPQYKVVLPEELTIDIMENGCVLLNDYTKQYSQIVLPRNELQEPLLQIMAECLPMARTALVANTGVKGIKVDDPDQGCVVSAAAQAMFANVISDCPEPWVPIASEIQMEDLTSSGSALKGEEYLLMMQGLDNYRLSLYGLKNGGLFQKKAHMLEAEAEMNDGNVGLVYQDGLTIRQKFCDIVNSIWGLGIWVEPSECVIGIDRNGDMMVGDNQDQSGTGEGTQPEMTGGDEDVE